MSGVVARLRADHGIVGANLAITIAFALFAVIELTRTLIAANSIDDRVEVIVGEVSPIDADLDEVAKLDETTRMAEEILAAAQPLSGQAGRIIEVTDSIDETGSAILGTAGTINAVVKDINANVSDILGNATSINNLGGSIESKLAGVLDEVRSIDAGVAAINGRADVIIDNTRAIENDLTNVDNLVNSIEVSARSICNSPAIMGGC